MSTFRCVTFGCRVNQYETQAIREQLVGRGFQEAGKHQGADWVVINSCTVTETADRECLATVRTVRRLNPTAQIVIAGCLVQRDHERLSALPGVRLLVGSNQKHRIGELIAPMVPGTDSGTDSEWSPRTERELNAVYAPLAISSFQGRSKAFVKVQDGCNRLCAFCKVPYVRGCSRSRPQKEVLAEVKRLISRGFQEVVLTGVAIGLWGRDLKPSARLSDLVGAVEGLPGAFRVRLSSLDSRDLDAPLLTVLRRSTKVCHHLHLSLQSGSDRVLRSMNRGYTTAQYQKGVQAVKRFWPDLGLTTDLMTGFPGEGEQDFEETLELCRRLQFAKVHVFPYSPRQGTTAWSLTGQLPHPVAKERARYLRQVAGETAKSFNQSLVGTLQHVLVEEVKSSQPRTGTAQLTLTGYTSQYVRAAVTGGMASVGKTVQVRLEGLDRVGVRGKFFPKCP